MSAAPEPIDWGAAVRVATAIAGPGPAVPALDRRRLRKDFEEFTQTSDALVRDLTGLDPPDPPGTPRLLDRAGWIRVNAETFRALLRPLGEKIPRGGPLGRRAASYALGAQLGIVLGYVSRKVLGQYDLFLATGGAGRVYYVAPNVYALERRYGLAPQDFRLWIALHEVTHRTQFAGVEWLRDHVVSFVQRYLGSVELDAGRLRAAAQQVRSALLRGPEGLKSLNVMQLLLTGEQREVLQQMQALMCVVEGHGNFVMDRIGAERIPSFSTLKETLVRRREGAGAAQRLFEKGIGIEMKYQQYALGERFVADVARRAGMSGLNRVWERAENLPTMEEIERPDAWLERVQAGDAPEGGAAGPRAADVEPRSLPRSSPSNGSDPNAPPIPGGQPPPPRPGG